jgi:predicted transcriptional regulator of viral defense system
VLALDYQKLIEDIIRKQHGTILSSDLDEYQIPRTYLQLMVAEGSLERLDRGVYVSFDSLEDELYALQSKYSKIVYSHETALYLHGLSDRNPLEYSVCVPSGYKVVERISNKCKVYYIKKMMHNIGVVSIPTSFGNPIIVYSVERTICDIFRSKHRIDIQVMNEALKRYVKRKQNDYSMLMNYAKLFKVESILRTYLELLL